MLGISVNTTLVNNYTNEISPRFVLREFTLSAYITVITRKADVKRRFLLKVKSTWPVEKCVLVK